MLIWHIYRDICIHITWNWRVDFLNGGDVAGSAGRVGMWSTDVFVLVQPSIVQVFLCLAHYVDHTTSARNGGLEQQMVSTLDGTRIVLVDFSQISSSGVKTFHRSWRRLRSCAVNFAESKISSLFSDAFIINRFMSRYFHRCSWTIRNLNTRKYSNMNTLSFHPKYLNTVKLVLEYKYEYPMSSPHHWKYVCWWTDLFA